MLEFEQLKLRLQGSEAELRDLKDAIGYDRLKREIDELELKAAAPGFWDDAENSQKILQKTGKLKNTVESYDSAFMDRCLALLSLLVAQVPVYELSCRPDAEAVLLTKREVLDRLESR